MKDNHLKIISIPKILIVDDLRQNIFMMQKMLDKLPVEIFTAESVNEFSSLIIHHSFALVILDIHLPEMEGFELISIMQENEDAKGIPIIFVTAISKDENYIFEGYEGGAVDYLFKRIKTTILISKVKVFLELNRQQIALEEEISRRKTAEQELEKARKETDLANRAKKIFLENMNHEIRTPMNAILGFSQILLDDKELNQEHQRSLRTISKAGNHLLHLIDNILDISKFESGQMQLNPTEFDLNDLMLNISLLFQLRCGDKNLVWKYEQKMEEHNIIYGDETKLRQILINLLGNAVKFTDSGEVGFTVTQEEGYCFRFEVYDTGRGIPRKAQKTIFESFSQDLEGQEKGGTGLGLTICKKHVEIMDGNLQMTSVVGEGSQFYFTLKLSPMETDDSQVEENGTENRKVFKLAKGCSVNALIVDDVLDNRVLLTLFLEKIGVKIGLAEDGEQALEKVRKNIPDIIFMDIRMPVMNGVEATNEIFKEYGRDRMKIIAYTASTLAHEREGFMKHGFHDFVMKPARREEIYACLKKHLDIKFIYEVEVEAIKRENKMGSAKV